jgi:excisionase family DNA binding protein
MMTSWSGVGDRPHPGGITVGTDLAEPEALPRFVSVRQIADALGVSADTVRTMAQDGRLPKGTLFGGKFRWPADSINKALSKHFKHVRV